jgi:hypothetical protein
MSSFSYATMETSTFRSESAITAAVRTFWNPLRTADTTTVPIFLPNVHGIGSDFLSLVRERIEVSVINSAKQLQA